MTRPSEDIMADGISIRVRVRRATSTAKLEYGEPQDMVCTIVHWDSNAGSVSTKSGSTGSSKSHKRQLATRRFRCASSSFANQFRSNSSSKTDPVPHGQFAPTLFFQARTHPGHTLEACCSLHSVSSYDSSLDPSIVSDTTNANASSVCASASANPLETVTDTTPVAQNVTNNHNSNTLKRRISNNSFYNNNNHNTFTIMEGTTTAPQNHQNNNHTGSGKRKNHHSKTYAVPCSAIKTVEKTSSLFRGYRIFFATGSRGSYELEFENKNGVDIMMAFLQATLPAERFVNLSSGGVGGGASMDGNNSDAASYLSTLDVEKLTERLAERERTETMSEILRKGVGQMVSSMEEMSSSFCGSMCCGGHFMMSSSVSPYEAEPPEDEGRDDSSPKTDNTTGTNKSSPTSTPVRFELDDGSNKHHHMCSSIGPLMELDEEKSTQGSVIAPLKFEGDNHSTTSAEMLLPSGLSMEMPE